MHRVLVRHGRPRLCEIDRAKCMVLRILLVGELLPSLAATRWVIAADFQGS